MVDPSASAAAVYVTHAAAVYVTHAAAVYVTHATEVYVTHAAAVYVTHATEEYVTHAAAVYVTHATEVCVTHATEEYVTHATEVCVTVRTCAVVTVCTRHVAPRAVSRFSLLLTMRQVKALSAEQMGMLAWVLLHEPHLNYPEYWCELTPQQAVHCYECSNQVCVVNCTFPLCSNFA
jgi:hypothetical protein